MKNAVKLFIYRNRILSKWYFSKKRVKSFSLNSLDTKIQELLTHKRGFYVEIGANDGINQSNTKYFEVFKGWRGILIEPHLQNYNLLKKSRFRQNWFFNCACVAFDYKSSNVKMIYSNLMTTSEELENDLESVDGHIEKSKKFTAPEQIHTFYAEARTMNSILVEANAPQLIDFLSLDVEGSEISVLKGINHAQFRFRYILVECRDFNKMEQYLILNRYILVSKLSHHDYLFKNNL